MEISSKWIEKYKFSVTNGRNATYTLDVPEIYGGEDTGPTALELSLMGLVGCLGTSYKMIADKMHLIVNDVEVKAIADKTMEDKTVTAIHIEVIIKSEDSKEKLEKCLQMAEETCPVDLIFHQTTIPIETKLTII
ncbi:MAG: OsmC family protein [Candidatus Heimdallarchaeota archaeon]